MPTYSRRSPYPAADSTPGRHNHEVGIVGVMRVILCAREDTSWRCRLDNRLADWPVKDVIR